MHDPQGRILSIGAPKWVHASHTGRNGSHGSMPKSFGKGHFSHFCPKTGIFLPFPNFEMIWVWNRGSYCTPRGLHEPIWVSQCSKSSPVGHACPPKADQTHPSAPKMAIFDILILLIISQKMPNPWLYPTKTLTKPSKRAIKRSKRLKWAQMAPKRSNGRFWGPRGSLLP